MIQGAYSRSSSGQSLVEVMVTVTIAVLILVALVGGATVGVRNIQYSRSRARAMELNREATEWLRSERAKGWSAFLVSLGSDDYYCLNSLSLDNPGHCEATELIDSFFKREVNIVKESENKIIITVSTFWNDSQGDHREEVETYLTSW